MRCDNVAMMSLDAPYTGAEASARLRDVIAAEIAAADGWIPFSRFMQLALYAPTLGYYSGGATKVGRDPRDGSDFATAPELTPLFARALARPIAAVLAAGGDTIVELGPGSGRLAADLLEALADLGSLPTRYQLLDVSAELRDRQRALLADRDPALAGRVEWLDALPAGIDGVVVANEVLDAIPVELVAYDDGTWRRRGVSNVDGAFVFADRPIDAAGLQALADAGLLRRDLPAGYVTELHGAAEALVASIAERLSERSVAFWIDYGFPESEYYHPQRAGGTVMAHRGHRATPDVLTEVGRQDLTAHVDFTGAARAARSAGARVVGYTSQASFLIDCGIADALGPRTDDARTWLRQASALQTLLSEAEMGELFKVLAIARRPWTLPGFARDRRASLEME